MIRRLTIDDIKNILTWDKHFFVEQLQTMISNPNYFNLGLFVNNTLISYMLNTISHDSIDLIWIATHPQYRAQGYATQLIKEIISSHKNTPIFLEVDEKNNKVINLYKKMGFIRVHIRNKYYSNSHNAIVMKK
ncbi:MAG: GNAT family N-acetyltransferase [Mycoplasmataceae bacterium]|jgi:ribosomal protein S18 acetylase RimI-like enzyme|nr:GNAT family N-acetyltransferase [Mycoplasmataceae bacterium]